MKMKTQKGKKREKDGKGADISTRPETKEKKKENIIKEKVDAGGRTK